MVVSAHQHGSEGDGVKAQAGLRFRIEIEMRQFLPLDDDRSSRAPGK